MKSKKPVSLIVTLAVLAAAGYGAYKYFNRPPTLNFLTTKVTRGPVEAIISATGTLAATRSVAVGSRVSGNVVKMYADYNTPVKVGQPLAEIDPSTFQTTLDQRQAALRSAQTQKIAAEVAEKRADVDIANAETSIANAKSALARAQSQAADAKRKYDLQAGLFKDGIVSKDALDSAKATWDQADLSVDSAQASLKTAQANLVATQAQREVTSTQKVQAEAQITQAQSQVDAAQLDLSFTRIASPVDGVVIARNMNEGQTVQASTTAPQLYEIAEDLTHMNLETNIDESDISRVVLGQTATFTVDAFPGQTFSGHVTQIRRAAVNNQNVISYTVIVDVGNPDLHLFPGMTANTRIIVDHIDNTLRIPSSALRFRPPTEGVKVIGDVAKGKGKGAKDGGKDGSTSKDGSGSKDGSTGGDTSKPISKAEEPVAPLTAQADASKGGSPDAANSGKGNFDPSQFKGRGKGKGSGNFDPSQFKGKGGNFDPSQFAGKGGGNFDPSQFQGRGGGQFPGGGRGGFGGGRGGAGRGAQSSFQTVYRVTPNKELEAIRVRTGITDGNNVQLLGTNLPEGAELVTSIEGLPEAPTQNKNNNNNNNNFNNGFPGGNNRNKGGFPF